MVIQGVVFTVALLACATPALASAVEVRDLTAPGDPRCGDVTFLDRVTAYGGCGVQMSAARFSMKVVTAFGRMAFHECSMASSALVAGNGETVSEHITVTGESPCPDAEQCFDGDDGDRVDHLWRGRILAIPGGRFVHRINACLDTCLGRFKGVLDLDLDLDRGGRWRSRTVGEGAIGSSGWELGRGSWTWLDESATYGRRSNAGTGLAISLAR